MATLEPFPRRVPGWSPNPTAAVLPNREAVVRAAAGAVRVLIVDDDAGMRRALRSLVSSERGMEIAGEAATGEEALEAVERLDPDLVLLDVVLPDFDGIAVVRRFGTGRTPGVIFVTGSERHAAAAFGVSAVDYVVKPFTLSRFRAALERFRRRAGTAAAIAEPVGREDAGRTGVVRLEAERPDVAGAGEPADRFGSRLWLRSRGQVQLVDVDDIEWIESDLRHCWVHLAGGERLRFREPIRDVEARLDPRRFARIHRSAIVNLDRVAEAISSSRSREIVLKSGERLPMSRSGRQRVFSPRAAR